MSTLQPQKLFEALQQMDFDGWELEFWDDELCIWMDPFYAFERLTSEQVASLMQLFPRHSDAKVVGKRQLLRISLED